MDSYFDQFVTEKYKERSRLKRFFITNFLQQIDRLYQDIEPQSVLELGCGEGFVSGYLHQRYPRVTFHGIDQDTAQLHRLNKLFPSITTHRADITQPLSDLQLPKYDLVMALEVLEHLPHPEKTLTAMQQLTKQYVLISVPWEPWFRLSNLLRGRNIRRLGNDAEHINHWTKHGITALLNTYYTVADVHIAFPWTILVAHRDND